MAIEREMNDLFREALEGHESPVDPGTWDAIQSQLAASAPVTDSLNDMFRERFQGHEAPVDPSAWHSISSQLGHPVAAGTSVWGWAAAGVAVLAIGTAAYFITNEQTHSEPLTTLTVAEVTPTAQSAIQIDAVPADPVPPKASEPLVGISPVTAIETPSSKTIDQVKPAIKMGPVENDHETGTMPVVAHSNDQMSEAEGQALVARIIADLKAQAEEAAKTEKIQPRSPEPVLVSSEPNKIAAHEVTDTPAAQGVDIVPPTIPLPKLFLPNVFTPNGDGVNDVYVIGSEGFDKVIIRVFSVEGGKLVFSSNNGQAWSGAQCADGYYMVAVEAVTSDGRSVNDSKVVWLNTNRLN